MVSLDADDAVAGKRERAEKEAAEKAAWALANPEEGGGGGCGGGRRATDEKPDEEKPDGDEEKTSEDANANEEEADEPYEYQAAADAAAHRAMVAEVLPLFGSPTASNNYARPVAVSTDECEDAAAALEAGLAAGMPQPPHPPDWIPPDELVAVVTKPKPRDARAIP